MFDNIFWLSLKVTRVHTHTHTHIYIYIYICVCVCVCRKTDNNDPSGRNDLLTGRHNSVSIVMNHHQDHKK